MNTDEEFRRMTEQLEDDYWTVRIHKDTTRLYGMYVIGILVGLILARKGAHGR